MTPPAPFAHHRAAPARRHRPAEVAAVLVLSVLWAAHLVAERVRELVKEPERT